MGALEHLAANGAVYQHALEIAREWVRDMLPAVGSTRAPRNVYHYTSAEGFLGILQSRAIRATAVEFLNDSRELVHAAESARQYIERERATLFPGKRDLIAEWVLAGIPGNVQSGVYVACFCADGDRLSQWRGYADRGLGFSLGFESRELAALRLTSGEHSIGIRFGRCNYRERELHAQLRDWCARLVAWCDASARRGALRPDMLAMVVSYAASLLLSRVAPFHKHPAFREEREWRLVVDGGAEVLPSVRVRCSGTTLIPYVDIPLSSSPLGTNGERFPLTDVVVGPGASDELALRAARHALGASSARVRQSRVPFRS